jgi:NAD(P)-dependent dehydrogenase (short-subunit alcohol dehydrogenase family)
LITLEKAVNKESMIYKNLHDKVGLITGGSRGIGQAIAKRLGKEGCHLYKIYRKNP